jgi:hypothetical protein
MIYPELLVNSALEKLEVTTGYTESTGLYFAVIDELGLKCVDFTEEAAVDLIKSEAEIVLYKELSKAKDIIKRDLR